MTVPINLKTNKSEASCFAFSVCVRLDIRLFQACFLIKAAKAEPVCSAFVRL